jgi:S1-C subfamily serine protease
MPTTSDRSPLLDLSSRLSDIVGAAATSLVSIESSGNVSSGLVWKLGEIVTADEALAEDGEISVRLPGGRRVAAEVIGRDPSTDIALLRADSAGAQPVELHETLPPAGALAIAVGSQNALPLVASGVVALSGPAWQSMRGGSIDARLELDITLRRIAEGGVAIGADGRPFGMAVFGPRRRVLVIPSSTISRIATQLSAHGKIVRGYLGLGLQPVVLAGDGGIAAMVMSVDADGPGARAGVHQGDVIAGWDGKPMGSVGALLQALGPQSVGETVRLSLRRAGDTRMVDVIIGERP